MASWLNCVNVIVAVRFVVIGVRYYFLISKLSKFLWCEIVPYFKFVTRLLLLLLVIRLKLICWIVIVNIRKIMEV